MKSIVNIHRRIGIYELMPKKSVEYGQKQLI